ncbi:hypothetical protein [Bdellovibrio sp. ZAP7]|uniref:hypothetical protein n=1 Tax=Bdellovibrio sp. ZAP7 TaxID=2231053 RepID=UPI0011590BD5|nr:hypothetical protein [Bdellovibrio sp. ZAP7]
MKAFFKPVLKAVLASTLVISSLTVPAHADELKDLPSEHLAFRLNNNIQAITEIQYRTELVNRHILALQSKSTIYSPESIYLITGFIAGLTGLTMGVLSYGIETESYKYFHMQKTKNDFYALLSELKAKLKQCAGSCHAEDVNRELLIINEKMKWTAMTMLDHPISFQSDLREEMLKKVGSYVEAAKSAKLNVINEKIWKAYVSNTEKAIKAELRSGQAAATIAKLEEKVARKKFSKFSLITGIGLAGTAAAAYTWNNITMTEDEMEWIRIQFPQPDVDSNLTSSLEYNLSLAERLEKLDTENIEINALLMAK